MLIPLKLQQGGKNVTVMAKQNQNCHWGTQLTAPGHVDWVTAWLLISKGHLLQWLVAAQISLFLPSSDSTVGHRKSHSGLIRSAGVHGGWSDGLIQEGLQRSDT